MNTLSVVISAYNEEHKIGETLRSVSFADEVIVIDNESSDETVRVTKKYTDKIFPRPNNRMLNTNKNYGFEKATSDWILNLDADERLTPELVKEIKEAIAFSGDTLGYWIPRKNIIFGKWIKHGLWWPDKQLRLFRRGAGKFPCTHVHEYITVSGKTGTLKEPMIHENYQTISQFLQKLDTIYTENEVETKRASGYAVAWPDAIRFPMRDFVSVYFAKEGYKDGLHGLVLSMLQAFYAFIVFAKLWEKEKFVEKSIPSDLLDRELSRAGKEVTHWQLSKQIESERDIIKRLLLRLKRKYVSPH